MANKLPGVNFQAPVSTADLEFQKTSNDQEIQERTRLEIGAVQNNLGRFGIVDNTDPQDISTTDIDRPLNVSVAPDNPLRVDITPGTGVTAYGNWVKLLNKITSLELASTAIGAVNVVFIEYFIEEGVERRVNKFNIDVAVRNQRPVDNDTVIKVDVLDNFNDAAQFSPDRLKDIVILSYVTVNQLSDLSLDLVIDLGGNNFPTNRPWYSPVDIEHRSKVGTADPTDTNPHGTSLNDLAAGRLTLYQQAVAHGMVLSKDSSVSRYPGIKTSEDIEAASFNLDGSGSVTRRSTQFGAAGSRYTNLQHFPISIGSAYATGNPARQISVDFVPDTNILVIPANEPIPTEGITVEYMFAQAGEGPVDPATNDLVFLQPAASELVVADGIAVSSIPTPIISFDGSGPIPRDFLVLLDSEGDLISTPQILQPPIKLDAMGTADLQITRAMRGSAPIEIGLTRANDVTNMEIILTCTGTDADGNAVSEDLTFNFANWSDTSVPATAENIDQFQRTTALFSELSTVRVAAGGRSNDGNDSTIIVYADQEASVTDTFKEKCPLADVFWDGLAVESVFDARPVSLDLSLPRTPIYNGTGTPEGQGARAWLYEDFRSPRYGDIFEGDESPSEATGSLTIVQNELISNNDTIDLGSGKILIAKTPAAASGILTALQFGINVPLGSTNFTINEQTTGNNISVSTSNGWQDPEVLAADIASGLTSNSLFINGVGDAIEYTTVVTTQRAISITAVGSNPFTIVSSSFATLLGFDTLAPASTIQVSAGQIGLNDQDTFTLGDGTDTEVFEFDTGGGALSDITHLPVNVGKDAQASETQAAIVSAISLSSLAVTASIGTGDQVNIVNDDLGAAGNDNIVESVSSGYSLFPSGMAGGTDGSAVTANGEFNVGAGTDFETTGDNIVVTLADLVFDSGVTGVRTDAVVGLTRNTGGVANNVIIGIFVNTAPKPIDISGFLGGAGRYIATSPDAFSEGLRTRIPASTADLDSVRKKYRSRSLGVPVGLQGTDVEKIAVVMHNPENVSGGAVSTPAEPLLTSSVRVQAALESDPGNWKGFFDMELISRNPNFAVFEHDFGEPIDKVQFEMFGIFTDFALADTTSVGLIGQGPTGTAGEDGATGDAGLDGADGAVGPTGAGIQGPTGPSASIYSQSFASATVWTVIHNLGTTDITWAAYDNTGESIFPTVSVVDANTVTMTFAPAEAGTAVIVGVS